MLSRSGQLPRACAWCARYRADDGTYHGLALSREAAVPEVRRQAARGVSHGICPACQRAYFPNLLPTNAEVVAHA